MSGRRDLWFALGTAIVAFAAYLPALTTGFNADDYLILWRIKSIERSAEAFAYFKFAFYDYFRPLGFLSFALDWRIWHLNAFGFHLTNILLHATTSLLVFVLLRRFADARNAALGALLFALHPASHEAVYWIAARFDLLATGFILLALLLLERTAVTWRAAGLLSFGFALLAKESAISLLIIAPAWDALVSRRDWKSVASRLLPLMAVVAAYAAVRSIGADLDATGGSRRLPKLAMTIAGVAGVLWLTWQLERPRTSGGSPIAGRGFWLAAGTLVATIALLLANPASTDWMAEKLAFVGHVTYYSLSPFVFPSPAPDFFLPDSFPGALPSVTLIVLALAGAASAWQRAKAGKTEAAFAVVFLAAALLPVSSMTGGLRYLYLPTAGVALLVVLLLGRLAGFARSLASAVIVAVLVVSAHQLLLAGRAWARASEITDSGVSLMAGSLTRCGEEDLLLMTAPVAIGGVYANLSWDAFDVVAGCAPRTFMTLLRVVRSDLRASLTSSEPGTIELKVTDYQGNIVASQDLRNFVVPIAPRASTTLETIAGTLTTYPEGPDGLVQVFRLKMTPDAQAAKRFYYSDGRIRPS